VEKIRGMTINGKHTRDLGLKLLSFFIPLPPVKETIITVPGMSGGIDATDVVAGHPTYGMREGLKFEFKLYNNWKEFEIAKSQLAEWLHGKKVKVVLDSDPQYYYVCRLKIDARKTNAINATIVVTGIAEPVKYEITSSDEDWLWDLLSFEDGVIRELKDVVISGNTEVTILAGNYSTSPIFKVSESIKLTVTYEGYTYPLSVGDIKIPRIRVGEKDVVLVFDGQGKLDISYRGERL
jgi:hypothetical protein